MYSSFYRTKFLLLIFLVLFQKLTSLTSLFFFPFKIETLHHKHTYDIVLIFKNKLFNIQLPPKRIIFFKINCYRKLSHFKVSCGWTRPTRLNGCSDWIIFDTALVDAAPEKDVASLTPSSAPRVTDDLEIICEIIFQLK